MRFFAVLLAFPLLAAEYAAPAGIRPATRRPGAASILPGGRIIAPLGRQYLTGPGAFGLAVSSEGKTIVSANGGPNRYSLTVLRRDRKGFYTVHHLVARNPRDKGGDSEEDDWRSVFMGLAFAGEDSVFASEGNSGRVRLIETDRDGKHKVFDLNRDGFQDSYTGDLALDAERGVLYVLDQANFRLVALDVRHNRVLSSTRLGRLPFALALSPDKRKAYVTNIGMFEYRALPGADAGRARETGLPFPAFGFPSAEAREGVRRATARGPVDVPGLGDPNVPQSNSVCVVDVHDPASPRVEAFVRTGLPFGERSAGGSSPSGILAADRVFVTNAHNDSITVIDPASNAVVGEIPVRIPGLESFRGVLPLGLAYHAPTGWLLVAEAGINAIGVIDPRKGQVLGHLPAGWFPTRVALDGDTVYVANAKGHGTGPNLRRRDSEEGDTFAGVIRRGTISVFPLPPATELPAHTAVVMDANGFRARPQPEAPLPAGIRCVVLIVKENRTFDEVLGDIRRVSSGPVVGLPAAARFGRSGYVSGDGRRLSLQRIDVTPNHHALALGWAFSDNFYADSEVSVDGHHWLVGSYPNAWTETSLMASYGGQKDFRLPTTAPGRLAFPESNSSVHPEEQLEAGTLWHHLERHGVPFRNFGEGFELAGSDEGPGLEPTGTRFLTNVPMPDPLYRNTSRDYPGFNMNIPDQYRAAQFIREIEERYLKTGAELPRLLFLHLPNDHMARPRPEDGYPYEASFVADNDYALGRIVEFLSKTPWWSRMAVLITEDDAQGGRDHVDSHRTVLIGAGPYIRRNYVSHVNSGFPGLLKTVFRLLGVPPLNLFDAVASDLSDMFTAEPDFKAYQALPVDRRLFDPAGARRPGVPRPSPRMDDPAVLRQQHRR